MAPLRYPDRAGYARRMMLGLLFACGGDVVHHPEPEGDSAALGLSIAALEPAAGPAAGGTFVRIAGSGYTTASAVTVAGTPCATLTFLSSVELFCTTPPGVIGAAEVVVTDGDEAASSAFEYLADDADTGDTDEPVATITSCTLDSPASMVVESDNYGDTVLGSVVVAGRTEGEGQAPGVEGGLGWGPAGSDPSTWEWWELGYVASAGDADQYDASFYIDVVAALEYTVRFRVDHGAWTTCELSTGGYGQLEATPPTVEEPVDYCHTQWPCSLTVEAGEDSEPVYAWIYEWGASDQVGPGEGLQFELGVGNDGTDPLADNSWSWSPMTFNEDKDGGIVGDHANDEFMGSFVAPMTPGSYDYVARASADYGLTWTLCDLGGDSCRFGGSTDGYDDPGECTVP